MIPLRRYFLIDISLLSDNKAIYHRGILCPTNSLPGTTMAWVVLAVLVLFAVVVLFVVELAAGILAPPDEVVVPLA